MTLNDDKTKVGTPSLAGWALGKVVFFDYIFLLNDLSTLVIQLPGQWGRGLEVRRWIICEKTCQVRYIKMKSKWNQRVKCKK